MFRLLFIGLICILAYQNCEDPKPPAQSNYGSSNQDSSSSEVYSITEYSFPPALITHPDNYVRYRGQQVNLRALVQPVYQASARYTWYRDGSVIPNKSQKYLELKQIQTEDAGIYHAEVKVGDTVLETEQAYVVVIDTDQSVHPEDLAQAVIVDQTGTLINYNWQTQPFNSCSAACGEGQTTRTVRCIMYPSNLQVDDSFCRGRKPEQVSNCQGTSCSNPYQFTDYQGNKAQKLVEVTAQVKEVNSELAERVFASLCDQGQLGCADFDRCEYVKTTGVGDKGSNSFCRYDDQEQSYSCTATCRKF